jgi:hypothetical protein
MRMIMALVMTTRLIFPFVAFAVLPPAATAATAGLSLIIAVCSKILFTLMIRHAQPL